MDATLKSIGQIRTPYQTIEACPNNVDANGPLCRLVVHEEFIGGLSGLQPGQEILILYWFENTDRHVKTQGANEGPNTGGEFTGTFALRSPHRPNPIGAAVLPIETIDNGVVTVKGLDCLNGTHLLDIKPAIRREVSAKTT